MDPIRFLLHMRTNVKGFSLAFGDVEPRVDDIPSYPGWVCSLHELKSKLLEGGLQGII